jgi:hypothetical protein
VVAKVIGSIVQFLVTKATKWMKEGRDYCSRKMAVMMISKDSFLVLWQPRPAHASLHHTFLFKSMCSCLKCRLASRSRQSVVCWLSVLFSAYICCPCRSVFFFLYLRSLCLYMRSCLCFTYNLFLCFYPIYVLLPLSPCTSAVCACTPFLSQCTSAFHSCTATLFACTFAV